jgi:N-acetyl-gamma-glutamyl-phosphate reductase
MPRVFIDGQEGTTGLQIRERLCSRSDIELLEVDPGLRKDTGARKTLLNQADIVITCLPDAAAREAISLIENPRTRVIDPSSAHRTSQGWVYGFPELDRGARERIRHAERVTVPGCHATGFVALLYPLVRLGVMPADYPVVAHSLTGHSGAGRKMIAHYREAEGEKLTRLRTPRPYALGLSHKHLPEMQAITGLTHAPLFEPVISDFYQGMLVSVPILPRLLPKRLTPDDVRSVLLDYYRDERFIRVMPLGGGEGLDDGFLNPLDCNGTNRLDVFVFGHDEQVLLVARLDNLGKGASGAAVQCLNILTEVPEDTGLTTGL